MNYISDYYYYLLLNGDKIDNVKQIFTAGQTIDYLNFLYNKFNKYNFDLVCNNISEFRDLRNYNDVIENGYLIDIFNQKTFTGTQRTAMNMSLNTFFKVNNFKVLD
jgi:hypothetical protein